MCTKTRSKEPEKSTGLKNTVIAKQARATLSRLRKKLLLLHGLIPNSVRHVDINL